MASIADGQAPLSFSANPYVHVPLTTVSIGNGLILRERLVENVQKNPRAHKNKIGTPPPKKPKIPPKTRNFMDMEGFPAERRHFSRCP